MASTLEDIIRNDAATSQLFRDEVTKAVVHALTSHEDLFIESRTYNADGSGYMAHNIQVKKLNEIVTDVYNNTSRKFKEDINKTIETTMHKEFEKIYKEALSEYLKDKVRRYIDDQFTKYVEKTVDDRIQTLFAGGKTYNISEEDIDKSLVSEMRQRMYAMINQRLRSDETKAILEGKVDELIAEKITKE